MPYKDKDRQREADRSRQRRRRDKIKAKGVTTQGVTTQGVTVTGSGSRVTPKRGKDIKCFEDLPADVQQTIDRISISPDEKIRRTAVAIHYQQVSGA